LKRGLEFTAAALRRNKNNPKEELSESFTKAYGDTLKQYHSFVIRPIFAVKKLIVYFYFLFFCPL